MGIIKRHKTTNVLANQGPTRNTFPCEHSIAPLSYSKLEFGVCHMLKIILHNVNTHLPITLVKRCQLVL